MKLSRALLIHYIHICLSLLFFFNARSHNKGALITAGALNSAHHRVDKPLLGAIMERPRRLVVERKCGESKLHKSFGFARGHSHQQQAYNSSDTTLRPCETTAAALICRRDTERARAKESSRTQSATKLFPDETKIRHRSGLALGRK